MAIKNGREHERDGPGTPSGSLTVLVVEDEPLIRMSAVDLVEEAGFRAVEARNADEAVAVLEQETFVAVLFTDVDMPGSMDGLELARIVADRYPEIRVIVASGHRSANELPGGALFFSKPYDLAELAAAMRSIVV